MFRRVFIFVMVVLTSTTMTFAQENVTATVKADIVNKFLWRGLDFGDGQIQPTLGISYKGLSLTAWGSVGFVNSDDMKELDLFLNYNIGHFNVGLSDFWNTDGQDPQKRYFLYDAHKTNHTFEINLGYDFELLNLQTYFTFAGNDGYNKSGKRAYSTYVELSAPFRLATCDWTATIGIVPMSTTYYETTGFAVTNVSVMAMKRINITDKFCLPIFAQLVGNPCTQKLYFQFGFTIGLPDSKVQPE